MFNTSKVAINLNDPLEELYKDFDTRVEENLIDISHLFTKTSQRSSFKSRTNQLLEALEDFTDTQHTLSLKEQLASRSRAPRGGPILLGRVYNSVVEAANLQSACACR